MVLYFMRGSLGSRDILWSQTLLWEAKIAVGTSQGGDLQDVMMCKVRLVTEQTLVTQMQPEGWAETLRMQAMLILSSCW